MLEEMGNGGYFFEVRAVLFVMAFCKKCVISKHKCE